MYLFLFIYFNKPRNLKLLFAFRLIFKTIYDLVIFLCLKAIIFYFDRYIYKLQSGKSCSLNDPNHELHLLCIIIS